MKRLTGMLMLVLAAALLTLGLSACDVDADVASPAPLHTLQ